MRPVLLALVLAVIGAGLCAGCMDTRTASLGVEAQRVPASEPDAGRAAGERDAGEVSSVPPDLDAAESGGHEDEQPVQDAEQDADTRSDALDGAQGTPDAGSTAPVFDAGPVASDAGAVDTSVAHADAARDAAREDAKAPPLNPLCIAEPWHCQ